MTGLAVGTYYKKGDMVDVVIDGETFTGEVVARSWYKKRIQVHIPFYFSESEKHGKKTARVSKSVWVDAETLTA